MLGETCPVFQSYDGGAVDKTAGCSLSPTSIVFWGGELLCKAIDPAGASICKTVSAGDSLGQISPANVIASMAGWWLLWRLFKGGR